jgi:hypothetical protein
VKQNPVLILMAYFMVVVGILFLDVAVQRLYRINVTSRSNNRLVLPLHSISNINM